MTVALRMTGALIVAAPGTPDDPYARVVFHLADGRELRYRDVRKFGRIGLFAGGGLAAGARPGRLRRVAERRRGVPGGRRLRPPRAGAAGEELHRGSVRASPRGPLGAPEIPAPRPVLHRRGRQHLRRRGAVARTAQPPASRGHPVPGRDPATASGRASRPSRGDRQPWRELQRLRGGRWRAGGQRGAAGGLPAHRRPVPALRPADRGGSWSGSAARTTAHAASLSTMALVGHHRDHEGHRSDREHRLRQEHRRRDAARAGCGPHRRGRHGARDPPERRRGACGHRAALRDARRPRARLGSSSATRWRFATSRRSFIPDPRRGASPARRAGRRQTCRRRRSR